MKRMHQTSWNGCFWGEFTIALWCQSQMSSTAMVPFENHRLWEDHLHHTVPAFLVTFFCNPRNLMLNCKWNASDSKTWSWITLGVHCFGIQQAKKIAAHRFQHVNTSMSFLSSKSAISFYNILHMYTYVTPRFRGFDGNDSRRHHVALANGEACSNQSELGSSFLFRLQEKVCDEIMSRGLMWFGLERRKASFRHASRQWLLSKREKREMLHHWKRGIMLYNNYVIEVLILAHLIVRSRKTLHTFGGLK